MTGIGLVGGRAGGRQESEFNGDRRSVLQEEKLEWVLAAVHTANRTLEDEDSVDKFGLLLMLYSYNFATSPLCH